MRHRVGGKDDEERFVFISRRFREEPRDGRGSVI